MNLKNALILNVTYICFSNGDVGGCLDLKKRKKKNLTTNNYKCPKTHTIDFNHVV